MSKLGKTLVNVLQAAYHTYPEIDLNIHHRKIKKALRYKTIKSDLNEVKELTSIYHRKCCPHSREKIPLKIQLKMYSLDL